MKRKLLARLPFWALLPLALGLLGVAPQLITGGFAVPALASDGTAPGVLIWPGLLHPVSCGMSIAQVRGCVPNPEAFSRPAHGDLREGLVEYVAQLDSVTPGEVFVSFYFNEQMEGAVLVGLSQDVTGEGCVDRFGAEKWFRRQVDDAVAAGAKHTRKEFPTDYRTGTSDTWEGPQITWTLTEAYSTDCAVDFSPELVSQRLQRGFSHLVSGKECDFASATYELPGGRVLTFADGQWAGRSDSSDDSIKDHMILKAVIPTVMTGTPNEVTLVFLELLGGGNAGGFLAVVADASRCRPRALALATSSEMPAIRPDGIVTFESAYLPTDARCCPSGLVRQDWEWQGRGLVKTGERAIRK